MSDEKLKFFQIISGLSRGTNEPSPAMGERLLVKKSLGEPEMVVASIGPKSDEAAEAPSVEPSQVPASRPVHFMDGRLLIATPQMTDKRFHRAVIFVCMHRDDGAMGIVINRLAGGLTYGQLMSQLGIDLDPSSNDRPVHAGGPVEPSRGFVLHSVDRVEENTMVIEGFGLTSTTDILRAIHKGEGPNKNILALGYAGWGPGQLDDEIRQNAWLDIVPDEALVFDLDFDTKWERAFAKLGVDLAMLSTEAGHA